MRQVGPLRGPEERWALTPCRTLARPLAPSERARRVTAVLGPTNTGKTHLAIERMVAHAAGIIGLPLRLLAREVYNRVVERVGAEAVALVTGEGKDQTAQSALLGLDGRGHAARPRRRLRGGR